MSNTIIIECNRVNSNTNEGKSRWTNNVSKDGIVVDIGDRVSVEGVAINSRGIGGDIMEIPEKAINGIYLNEITLRIAYYITNDGRFLLPMPWKNYAVNTTQNQKNFGIGTDANFLTNFSMFQMRAVNDGGVSSYGNYIDGYKYYLLDTDGGKAPNEYAYKYYTEDIDIQVNTGFDNPQGIADQITKQLNAASNGSFPASASMWRATTINDPSTALDQLDLPCYTGKNYRQIDANGCKNGNPASLNGLKAYNNLCVLNPGRWIGGCNLLNTERLNDYMGAGTNNILSLVNYVKIPRKVKKYLVVITNIVFPTSETDINTLRLNNFYKNTSRYYGNKMGFDNISNDKENWISKVNIARINDDTINRTILTPLWTAAGGGMGITKLVNMFVYSKYTSEMYKNASIEAPDGFYIYKDDDVNKIINDNNWGVVCIKNDGDSGITSGLVGMICPYQLLTEEGGDVISTDVERLNYFGFDPSFVREGNEACIPINTNRVQFQAAAVAPTFKSFSNFINIGAPSPQLQFNGELGRFQWEQFHYSQKIDNRNATAPANAVGGAGADILRIGSSSQTVLYSLEPFPKTSEFTYGLFDNVLSAQSGIGIVDMFAKGESGGITITNDNIKDTLLGRMGFKYYDMIGFMGEAYNEYNYAIERNKYDSTLVDKYVNPISTNGLFDTSIMTGVAQGGGEAVVPFNDSRAYNLPMYSLGFSNGFYAEPTIQSSVILASNLPEKLVYPYWLLYSDVIQGVEFYGRNKVSCLGVIGRSYTAGDYAYSFSFDTQFYATKSFVITDITTHILNPDLTDAEIDDNTIVLYKIIKPIKQFIPPPQPTSKKAK